MRVMQLMWLLLLAACTRVDSQDVRTSGLFANYSATANSDAALSVSASLKVGGRSSNTLVELGSGEYLELTGGGQTRQLSATPNLLGGTIYTSSLSGLAATSELLLNLTLVRSGEPRVDTPLSLPQRFAILAPAANSRFSISAGAQISLSWSPAFSAEPMVISAQSSCPNGHRAYFSVTLNHDSGSYTLLASELVADLLADPLIDPSALNCQVGITLSRQRTLAIVNNRIEGEVVTSQRRQLLVELVP